MKLSDPQLKQAYEALSGEEKRAVANLLRHVPGADRAKLQASAMRRIKSQLKRQARAERETRDTRKPGRRTGEKSRG